MIKKIYLTILFSTIILVLSGCGENKIVNINNDVPEIVDNITIQGELQEQIDILELQKEDFTFPSWLESIHINEPKGMKLSQIVSSKTTEKIEGFNSIHFVYHGNYDLAMTQAKLIAANAKVPVSKEFKMAQDLLKSLGTGNSDMQKLMGDMKGVVYTNYSLFDSTKDSEKLQYNIAITVNEDGSLEIDVTDIAAMQNISDKYVEQK